MPATVSKNELNNAVKRINRALEEITDVRQRKRINQEAGKFVQAAARVRAPRSRKPHYVYRTRKANSKLRAKRNSVSEQDKTKYLPGNLALSIRVLNLRRAIRAVIGPRILRKASARVYGRNERNVNAFYAQMIFGSARAFRKEVMEPALSSQRNRVEAYIRREIEKLTRKAARKNNL